MVKYPGAVRSLEITTLLWFNNRVDVVLYTIHPHLSSSADGLLRNSKSGLREMSWARQIIHHNGFPTTTVNVGIIKKYVGLLGWIENVPPLTGPINYLYLLATTGSEVFLWVDLLLLVTSSLSTATLLHAAVSMTIPVGAHKWSFKRSTNLFVSGYL